MWKPTLKKTRLGRNFPRKMLHARVTAMGVEIVASKTAIVVLTLKLYFSHKRMNSENIKMLKTIENNSTIWTGSKGGSSGENKANESGPMLWIEGASKILDNRRARFKMKKKITKNKTIMDCALHYAKK